MKELLVGSALLGAALWSGRRGGSFGAIKEKDFLYETKNLMLLQSKKGLEIQMFCGTYSINIGSPKDVEDGKRFIDRMERNPKNIAALRKFYRCGEALR